jgi:cellulose synthase/poly-beta-1,6-N-acetylglucosamine synthase-like glycosyltransferase
MFFRETSPSLSLMYLYYFFAAVSIWFGIQSFLSGLRYVAYVRRETARPLPDFQPFVSVIAPCRGLEPGLKQNLSALLHQSYPAYEIIFVLDSAEDPASRLIENLLTVSHTVATKKIIAGAASDSGQKVHNLRAAVKQISDQTEVLVFVDTDARPGRDWLRNLVGPLVDQSLGATTGYRWFLPVNGGLASRLRSVWNGSIASALGQERKRNFCWGGSTAIRRSTFERLNIYERWRGSVSDDFTITRLLHEATLPIYYAPNCLIPSVGDCTFHELLEFTTRQLKITRVYAPHLWKPLLMGAALFNLVFFGGVALLLIRLLVGSPVLVLSILLSIMFLLGTAKSFLRWGAVRIPLNDYRFELTRDLMAQLLLWPLASSLYLYNALCAGFSRRIEWRGITYELKSPSEAVIISRGF